MIKALKKVGIADQNVAKFQENVVEVLQPVLLCPLLDGVLLKSVTVATTPTLVEHKLGREFRGFVITNKNANANVWQTGTNPSSRRFISLQSSTAIQVDLWVF